MKIGILSFHASHNYGSMLQNYALQQFLIAEGHSVETINLRNNKQRYMYNNPLLIGKSNPTFRTLLGRIRDPRWLFGESKRWQLFERFLKERLILTKEYSDWNSIKTDLPNLNYDAIIVGGDQIWNTYCFDFDWSYFLPDNIKPIRTIAFSPSFGNRIPDIQKNDELRNRIQEYLRLFDRLSVREKDASAFLQDLLKITIPVIADPTFLLQSLQYHKLLGEPLVKGAYIYYYTPSHIPSVKAEGIAIELAHKLGLKIVTSYPRFMGDSQMIGIASGPIEFLNLLNNAQIVVGMSYHLVIFSLIFHKTFITIGRRNDARLNTLLDQMKISGRNIESADDYDYLNEIDYNTVDGEITKFKQEAINYLRNALDE